jgi:hypothetical protein
VHYRLQPHVAGELGPETDFDPSTHPPVVKNVVYVLDFPEPDDLIESFPVFLVAEALCERLGGLSGFELEPATVVFDGGSRPFRRLVVTGTAADDAWIDEDLMLCVSAEMLEALRTGRLRFCDIEAVG